MILVRSCGVVGGTIFFLIQLLLLCMLHIHIRYYLLLGFGPKLNLRLWVAWWGAEVSTGFGGLRWCHDSNLGHKCKDKKSRFDLR